jgi:hypothetical protein
MSQEEPHLENEPLFLAAVDLVHRTGARTFSIRYSDDNLPIVWMAVAEYEENRWDAGAGTNPTRAVMRLLDQLIDGGTCKHCNRPAGVTEEWIGGMPLADAICWYRFDPETKKFRRGCE